MIDGDEDLEDREELPLRDQIGLAGLVNQLRDLAHRPVHRQVLQLVQDDQAEQRCRAPTRPCRPSAACGRCSRRRRPDRDRAAPGWPRRRAARSAGRRAAGSGCCASSRGRQAASIAQQRQRPRTARTAESRFITVSAPLNVSCLACRLQDLLSMRPGSDMPPVRKIRMPSSTVRSGNSARSRGIHHDVAEIQMVGRHVHRHQRFGTRAAVDRELLRQESHHPAAVRSPPPSRRA